MPTTDYDLVIAGGGVNGCGIARDATLRGMRVLLCEAGDLACATSSASSKLIHGGLRYLENREFKLVREALAEREHLLRIAPHAIRPLRFILPHNPAMRPAWMVRIGLALYDRMARRDLLGATTSYQLGDDELGEPLQHRGLAFEYSDCWVDDARFVVLNALDAHNHGATILTHTQLATATAQDKTWRLKLTGAQARTVTTSVLVNATGPWASALRGEILNDPESWNATRMVQGSHIIVLSLFKHDKAYILQNHDRRIIFAIPYAHRFTLIGTTDNEYTGDLRKISISAGETDYLLDAINRNFRRQLSKDDIIWDYSGVRGLYDDGASDAQEVTRDYVIKTETDPAPLINVFGGKLTTYRRLAEAVVDKSRRWCPEKTPCTTGQRHLPGGNFPVDGCNNLATELQRSCIGLSAATALRLTRAYGTLAMQIVGSSKKFKQLGENFGANLTATEVRYLMDHEWATNATDVLWRRSKLGLALNDVQQQRLATWMAEQPTARP